MLVKHTRAPGSINSKRLESIAELPVHVQSSHYSFASVNSTYSVHFNLATPRDQHGQNG